jgi:hypothetical protein
MLPGAPDYALEPYPLRPKLPPDYNLIWWRAGGGERLGSRSEDNLMGGGRDSRRVAR